jgi:hypothetical protein
MPSIKSRLRLGGVLLATLLGGAAWYAFRPERAFIDAAVSEAAPVGAMTLVATGRFEPREHEGAGVAQIYKRADGSQVLRFSNFRTLNGPDVRVYLIGAPDVGNGQRALATAGYLDLGALKGNVGDQNYNVPAGTDLSRYRSVTVWCRRFSVNFTTAALTLGP